MWQAPPGVFTNLPAAARPDGAANELRGVCATDRSLTSMVRWGVFPGFFYHRLHHLCARRMDYGEDERTERLVALRDLVLDISLELVEASGVLSNEDVVGDFLHISTFEQQRKEIQQCRGQFD